MDISYESYLLRQYLHEYIDSMKPVTVDHQVKVYSKRGYIDEGHNGKTFPDFATWKKIREMFPKDPIKEVAEMFDIGSQKLNELKPEDLIFIPRRDSPIDVISRAIIRQYAINIDRKILGI